MITIIKFRSYMVGPFLGSHSISLSPFSQTTSLNPLYTFIRARRIPLSLCWSWLDCRRNIFSFSPDKLGNYITPFVVVWQFFCASRGNLRVVVLLSVKIENQIFSVYKCRSEIIINDCRIMKQTRRKISGFNSYFEILKSYVRKRLLIKSDGNRIKDCCCKNTRKFTMKITTQDFYTLFSVLGFCIAYYIQLNDTNIIF